MSECMLCHDALADDAVGKFCSRSHSELYSKTRHAVYPLLEALLDAGEDGLHADEIISALQPHMRDPYRQYGYVIESLRLQFRDVFLIYDANVNRYILTPNKEAGWRWLTTLGTRRMRETKNLIRYADAWAGVFAQRKNRKAAALWQDVAAMARVLERAMAQARVETDRHAP